jgi:hypothetical protein
MNGKKHPLTFFREQNEARMRKAQDSTSVTPADSTIYPKSVIDSANNLYKKFDKATPGTDKRTKAHQKLTEFKTAHPNLVWNRGLNLYENKYK